MIFLESYSNELQFVFQCSLLSHFMIYLCFSRNSTEFLHERKYISLISDYAVVLCIIFYIKNIYILKTLF